MVLWWTVSVDAGRVIVAHFSDAIHGPAL